MTINSKLPYYKDEVKKVIKDEYVASKVVNLLQRAFSDGVVSIIQSNAKKSANKTEAIENLNQNISDFYVEKNYDLLFEYFLGVIDNITRDGKLILSYQDVAKEDFKNIIKAIYDMGLIAGTQIAQDPKQLSIFFENREKIESGKY
jgi:hypothetical protein